MRRQPRGRLARARARNGAEAVRLAELACRESGEPNAIYVDILAAAYAEAGQHQQAVETARRAADLADAAGDQDLASAIRRRMALYQAGQAYHELP